jgi:hypothetical protein
MRRFLVGGQQMQFCELMRRATLNGPTAYDESTGVPVVQSHQETTKQFEFCNSLFRKYLSVHDGSSGGSGTTAGSTAASATGVGWGRGLGGWGLMVEGWGWGGGWGGGRGQDLAHAARIRRAVGCDCDKSHAEGSTENTRRDEGREGLGKRWSAFLAAFVGATGTCPVATQGMRPRGQSTTDPERRTSRRVRIQRDARATNSGEIVRHGSGRQRSSEGEFG